MPVRKILERRPIYCGRRLLTLGMTALTITASATFPADIAEQAVAQAEGSRPRAGRAEAAPVAPGAPRARAQPLVVEEERAIALRHLHRRARDVAGPREHVLAVLSGGRAHAAVEEEDVRVGSPVVARSRLGHRPEG